MGLAASQARLLTLQSRMNDLELQCMRYSNEEITMSMMSNNVSIKYNQMLEAAEAKGANIISTNQTTTGNSNSNAASSAYLDYATLRQMGYDIGVAGAYGQTSPLLETAKADGNALRQGIVSGQIGIFKNGKEVSLESLVSSSQKANSNWSETTTSENLDYSERNKLRQEAETWFSTEQAKISQQEKILQMKSKQANTQYQAACTEFESAKSLVSKNAERGFSIWS